MLKLQFDQLLAKGFLFAHEFRLILISYCREDSRNNAALLILHIHFQQLFMVSPWPKQKKLAF
jgi:hypothetical protein